MSFKITVDTGGTFTDVVVSDGEQRSAIGKAPTTAERAYDGVREALDVASEELGLATEDVLRETSAFVYSTTRATNAIIVGDTARTAFLVTAGFPDILNLREGGKADGYDFAVAYPKPYVPRRLTYEVPERIDAQGDVLRELDEDAVLEVLRSCESAEVEAIAVCLLWSVANGSHERRIGELIEQALPGVPFTLSHEVNPIVREFRRGSSAAIDASLKPLMGSHLRRIGEDLRDAGLKGDLMVATSYGGVLHVDDVAARPILSVRSGPSMAPVAGRLFSQIESDTRDVIVCDTGGTSFDVSLVRDGTITSTTETWLGGRFTGHLTGTSSVDIRSIGSGGGSIAWIDPGGLLRVGPQSAGANPGPASYGRGGTAPTVTDAAVLLGYIDPEGFLDGRMHLDADAARAAFEPLAAGLSLDVESAAASVLTVANEEMVRAIHEITINVGVDPREAVVVAGGGAAGLGVVPIVRELGCGDAFVPKAAGALSAMGGQFSDIVVEFSSSFFTDTTVWDHETVNTHLDGLRRQADEFAARLEGRGLAGGEVEYFVEARYAYQVWELEIPVPKWPLDSNGSVEALRKSFDAAHERVFSVSQGSGGMEFLTWKARLRAPAGASTAVLELAGDGATVRPQPRTRRQAYFDRVPHDTPIYLGRDVGPGMTIEGPAIVEEPTSTLVVPPGSRATTTKHANYHLEV